MSEYPRESETPSLERRRDALFLRLIGMRDAALVLGLEGGTAAEELTKLHDNVMHAVTAQDIALLEEAFAGIENSIVSNKR